MTAGRFGKEIKADHDPHEQADHNRRNRGQEIKAGATSHTHGHGKEDKAHIARILDRVTKTHNRERAHQGKRPRNIRSDNQHNNPNDHTHQHQRMHVRLRIGRSAMSDLVGPAHNTG